MSTTACTYENSALDHLRTARIVLIGGRDNGHRGSRELSIALTEVETAILWLEQDIRTKERRVQKESRDPSCTLVDDAQALGASRCGCRSCRPGSDVGG